MINVVIFQFVIGMVVVSGFILAIYGAMKGKRTLSIIGDILLITGLIVNGFVYFNFTGSDKRVKEEAKQSNMIFQSEMKIPTKHIQEFNYSKDFRDISSSISKETKQIHNEVKKGNF